MKTRALPRESGDSSIGARPK